MLWTAVAGVLFFAAASFFFALAESALFSLGKWRARQLAERAPARGGQVLQLLDQPQDVLATILFGNTFANAAMVAVALWTALPERNWPLGLTVAALLVVILVVCEVIPKTLAVRVPEEWALRVAVPMLLLTQLTRPLRRIAQGMNDFLARVLAPSSPRPAQASADEEYRELVEMAFQQGTLAAAEKEIILQIISLDRRTARDVMQPRAKMDCLADDTPVAEMITAAKKFQHRRLPLYDETPDTIVGILNTRTLLLNPDGDLADAIEFPSFVPESMNLLQLLKSLQRQHRGLAIVLDEFGGTAGLVTVEDILEKMIGNLRSEAQPAGFVMEKLGPDRWRVSGTMRLEDFRREYPELGEVPDVDTMGGLMLTQMEVVPATGESVTFRGLRLTAKAVNERRVREVLVERAVRGKAREAGA